MSVYVFSLLAGFVFGGVDTAQGDRAGMLENGPLDVHYVFVEMPSRNDVIRYNDVGIKTEQMLSVHQYLAGRDTLGLKGKAEDKVKELTDSLHCTDEEWLETEIRLFRASSIVATILLDRKQEGYYYGVHYFNHGRLVRTEIYTGGLAYTDYYVTAKSDRGEYAKRVRRTFYQKDGRVAYDLIFEGEKEWYLFPEGRLCTKQQFFVAFLEKLALKEQDTVILDRPARYDIVQPLFQFEKNARLIVIIHSGHFFERGEDPFDLYLNREYNYCFKYAGMIDTMVVSTEEQKRELTEKLLEYRCEVPKITVIPAGGIKKLKYPVGRRRPYSMLSVSRLAKRKKVEWVLKAVIKAHRVNTSISLDVYGQGDSLSYLQDIVSKNQAEAYIRFMGWTDVTEVYQNYEVYITASLWETLGLSLMEAVASGNAMIGLDVKYGNRLFIRSGENGYLVNFHTDYVDGDDEKLTDEMAKKIIEIFADRERLEKFHQCSYEIAEKFSIEMIEKQWKNLLM